MIIGTQRPVRLFPAKSTPIARVFLYGGHGIRLWTPLTEGAGGIFPAARFERWHSARLAVSKSICRRPEIGNGFFAAWPRDIRSGIYHVRRCVIGNILLPCHRTRSVKLGI